MAASNLLKLWKGKRDQKGGRCRPGNWDMPMERKSRKCSRQGESEDVTVSPFAKTKVKGGKESWGGYIGIREVRERWKKALKKKSTLTRPSEKRAEGMREGFGEIGRQRCRREENAAAKGGTAPKGQRLERCATPRGKDKEEQRRGRLLRNRLLTAPFFEGESSEREFRGRGKRGVLEQKRAQFNDGTTKKQEKGESWRRDMNQKPGGGVEKTETRSLQRKSRHAKKEIGGNASTFVDHRRGRTRPRKKIRGRGEGEGGKNSNPPRRRGRRGTGSAAAIMIEIGRGGGDPEKSSWSSIPWFRGKQRVKTAYRPKKMEPGTGSERP